MALKKSWSECRSLFGPADEARGSAVSCLRHRYVREKQQAMRYNQHAEKMRYPQFRDALARIAADEERHALMIAEKIKALGAELPEVIPIHVAKESNSWHYLRTDLEEEQRCAEELHEDRPAFSSEFPDVVELIESIEEEGKKHRAQLRDMIARTDPQALWPA
jgi:rubrerythrin